jgi:hypothetical protein
MPIPRRALALLLSLACGSAAGAEEDARLRTDIDRELAQQLWHESQARQACKEKICEIARSKAPAGEDVACAVVKTWPAVDLKEKILRGKLDWPFGNAQCATRLLLARSLIVAAMSQAKYEAKVGKHEVECRLSAKDATTSQLIKFTIDPVVVFENAKAVRAALNWGNVSGSAGAKGALWSASAVDNTFNVLQGIVLEQINEFFGPKCEAALAKP